MYNELQKREQQEYKGERKMLKELEYETVLVRVVMAVVAAVAVVMGIILLMGIQLTTCNPAVMLFGVTAVAALFTVCAYI